MVELLADIVDSWDKPGNLLVSHVNQARELIEEVQDATNSC
jgi:hypothetical protein